MLPFCWLYIPLTGMKLLLCSEKFELAGNWVFLFLNLVSYIRLRILCLRVSRSYSSSILSNCLLISLAKSAFGLSSRCESWVVNSSNLLSNCTSSESSLDDCCLFCLLSRTWVVIFYYVEAMERVCSVSFQKQK